MKMMSKQSIMIAGHRGNPSAFPENTVLAFDSAIQKGVDMIETDVRVTKDNVLVLMHDEDVRRTTDGEGLVREMTYSDLSMLRVGDPALSCRIPMLKELLDFTPEHPDLLLDIEIKVYSHIEGLEAAKYCVDETVKLCKEYGICDRVMLNCFDYQVLKYIKETYGDLFVTHGYYPYTIMKNVTEDPTPYLDYACFWGDPEEPCRTLKEKGIEPCTGSNTTQAAFLQAARCGCSMFTENRPEDTIQWRDTLL